MKDPRDEWQDAAIKVWYDKGARGTIEAATATGKSFVGKKVIDILNQKAPQKSIHVIVPSIYLKKQWETNYIEKFALKNTKVWVINTYVKKMNELPVPHLIIMDEIHNYAAPTFKLATGTKAPFVLGLTATMERKDGLHLILQRFAPIVYSLPMAKARQMGIVAQYEIYNLGIDINESDKEEYEKLHGIFNSLFASFNYDFNLAMRCSYKNAHYERRRVAEMLTKDNRPVYEADVQKMAFQWSWAMRERKKFFYEAASKVGVVKDIYERYKVPTIVFSESTKFADRITDSIGDQARSYHTQLSTQIRQVRVEGKAKKVKMGASKLRTEALEMFNSGKITCLSTARALNEGFSVDGVELAILASYTSDIRSFVQRMGRAVRFLPGKEAKIIALYLKSFTNRKGEVIRSQEEKWLREAQRNQPSIRWIDSLDQIDNFEKVLL